MPKRFRVLFLNRNTPACASFPDTLWVWEETWWGNQSWEVGIWDTGAPCYSLPPVGTVRGRCGCLFGRMGWASAASCWQKPQSSLFLSFTPSLFWAVLSLSERMLQAVALIKSSCVGQMSQAQWNARNAEAQRERERERVCLQEQNSNQCSGLSTLENHFHLE